MLKSWMLILRHRNVMQDLGVKILKKSKPVLDDKFYEAVNSRTRICDVLRSASSLTSLELLIPHWPAQSSEILSILKGLRYAIFFLSYELRIGPLACNLHSSELHTLDKQSMSFGVDINYLWESLIRGNYVSF